MMGVGVEEKNEIAIVYPFIYMTHINRNIEVPGELSVLLSPGAHVGRFNCHIFKPI